MAAILHRGPRGPGDMTKAECRGKLGLAISNTADIMVAIDSKAMKERVGGARPQESIRPVKGCGKRH